MSGTHERWRSCDDCGAQVPVHDLIRPWCDVCGWNISEISEGPRGLLDRKMDVLGEIHGEWLLKRISQATEAELRPRTSLSTLIAYALSAVIVGLTLLIGLAGLYLLISGWPHAFFIIGGIILLVVAWFLRPRLGSLPKDCLDRGEFPKLFEMTDAIAAKLAIEPVERIRITPEFNASMAEVGLSRTPILTIGLLLWVSLTSTERVSLVAHELAHRANHDPARGAVVACGVATLDRWCYLLDPTDQVPQSFFEIIVHFMMGLLGGVTGALRTLLASLLYLDSQRAEYLADHLEAKIAGQQAAVKSLHKLGLGSNLRAVVDRVYYGGDTDGRSLIHAFGAFVKSVPERELERIRRTNEKERSRVDSSHPPTGSRIKFIESRAYGPAVFVLDDAHSRAIDAELEPLFERHSMKIMGWFFD
ncbi:M48 family metalloprotease [Taklimakanibacter lacteus]|uniref:M48 family metalloprotease n=1 Tax=Taklimakanibacter lacteus TaxID=2268456 RepID=UPI0013C4C936